MGRNIAVDSLAGAMVVKERVGKRRREQFAKAGIGVLAVCMATAAYAQPETNREADRDDIIVNGTVDTYAGGQIARDGRVGILGDQKLRDIPFSVNAYTSQTIINQGARAVSDVLANNSSVRLTVSRAAVQDAFFIRGFRAQGFETFSINGLFGLAGVNRIPVEAYDRVELFQGASAMLTGAPSTFAIGGVINLVPKRATAEPINSLKASFVSDGNFGGHADFGRRLGPDDVFGVRMNAVVRDGALPIDNASEHFHFFSGGFDVSLENLRMGLDLLYQSQKSQSPASNFTGLGGGVTAIPNAYESRNNLSQPWEFSNEKTISALGRIEYDLAEPITLFAAVGTSKWDIKGLLSRPRILDNAGNFSTGLTLQVDVTHIYSGEVGTRVRFSTGPFTHKLALVGSFYTRRERYDYINAGGPLTSNIYDPVYYPKIDITPLVRSPLFMEIINVKGLALVNTVGVFDDRLLITGGIRRQSIRTRDISDVGTVDAEFKDSAVTPSVGVLFKATPQLSVYGSFMEALTPGLQSPNDPALTNPGQSFAPTRSKQYEAGVRLEFEKINVNFTAFQIQQPSGLIVNNSFEVSGQQRNRGLEINAFGEPLPGFRVLSGVTFLRGKLVRTATPANNGNYAPGVPKVQANLGLEWDPPVTGLTLTGRMLYTTKQYFNAANTLSIPKWTRLDAGIRYANELGKVPFSVRLNVENVLDKNDWTSSANSSLYISAPRTFLLSVGVDL